MEAPILDTQQTIEEIQNVLRYFSIFDYPLTAAELHYFLRGDTDRQETGMLLQEMVLQGLIQHTGDFYFDPRCSAGCVAGRIANGQRAGRLLPKARRAGRLIALFPFVKFVGISGSLSKGNARKDADFDFFIITASNTLWICRTLLHLFKKLTFLFGGQHRFCMNYFIDERHLVLEEQNMFTQMELATLIPLNNPNLFQYFLLKNELPNIGKVGLGAPRKGFTRLYEQVFLAERYRWLTPLNLFLMRFTDNRWRKKWRRRNFPEAEYDLCFKTRPYVSKNHPNNYQKHILNLIDKS